MKKKWKTYNPKEKAKIVLEVLPALKQKLANTKRVYERKNYEEAQDLLQSYIEQVKDLAGNKLPEEEVNILIL